MDTLRQDLIDNIRRLDREIASKYLGKGFADFAWDIGCWSCTHFKPHPFPHGVCRRYPPIADNAWPQVNSQDICGEYESVGRAGGRVMHLQTKPPLTKEDLELEAMIADRDRLRENLMDGYGT